MGEGGGMGRGIRKAEDQTERSERGPSQGREPQKNNEQSEYVFRGLLTESLLLRKQRRVRGAYEDIGLRERGGIRTDPSPFKVRGSGSDIRC